MTVALSQGRNRAILTALGAVASLTAADVPGALLTRSRHVHASSYFLLQDSLGPGLAGLLAAARAAGATTSLDTNWDPSGRWGDERLSTAIAQADLLLPNEAEALRLSGAASLEAAAGTSPPPGQLWSSSSANEARCARKGPGSTRSACRPWRRSTPPAPETASTRA